MTNHNHSISNGSFKRGRRLLFILALAAAWLGQARLFHSTTAASAASAGDAALRGQAAIDHLKKEGTYESLRAAVAAARGPQTPATLNSQDKLTAGDGAAQDNFGQAVALSGNTAAVGAHLDDVAGQTDQGSVYVFTRSGSLWTQQARLSASDSSQFGYAVALSGDTLVVGAPSTGINTNLAQGAAYVFVRTGTSQPVWTQQAKLVASDGAALDFLGLAVAVSGDTAVVGTPYSERNNERFVGAAYVFVRTGTTQPVWTQQAKITASDGLVDDYFGGALAINGDTLVAGAAGVNAFRGAAYVFARSGAVWTQQQKLTISNGAADDDFGAAVSLSGNTMLIGAPGFDNSEVTDQGAAYVFVRGATTWSQQARLVSDIGNIGNRFGQAVALSGDTALVGAPYGYDSEGQQGVAYAFLRTGASWSQREKLVAYAGRDGERFGGAVALSGDTALAGAGLAQVGSNLAQGAAYLFALCGSLSQPLKLVAPDGMINDLFGSALALSGNTLAVGVPFDDIGTHANQGSVYVFVRTGSGWSLQQTVTSNDGIVFDLFGSTVALSGDTLMVGSPYFLTGTPQPSGAVHIFVRTGTTWQQQARLAASEIVQGDGWGKSIALSGDTAFVGAARAKIGANMQQGAVYVYARTGTSWSLQQKLAVNDSAAYDNFGTALALNGDTALVGTPGKKVGNNERQGAVYVFARSGAAWSQQQKLTGAGGAAYDEFGSVVALNDTTAAVGNYPGFTAYVFQRGAGGWAQQQRLTPSDSAGLNDRAPSLALSDRRVVIGAPFAYVGGNFAQGAAYVFVQGAGGWSQEQKLTADDGQADAGFGTALTASNDTILVGAPYDMVGGNLGQGSVYSYGVRCADCPALTLAPATVSNGAVGAAYSQTLTASGGTGPYQFSLSDGTLPAGLALSTTGLLSGTPATSGTYSFTVTATVPSLCTASRSYTLVITPPCQTVIITPATLPDGTAAEMYTAILTATGGTAPYTFAVSAGSLPNGMTLSPSGVLSGTPTTFGTFNFTVTATDANGCTGTRAYSLTIASPCATITINPPSLPAGPAGEMYTAVLTAGGGIAPYTFTISAGSLPSGMTLSPSGTLTGTPATSGTFNFTVTVTDANGCTGTRAYSLTINGAATNNGLQFYPLPKPLRLLDTRAGFTGCDAPGTPIAGGTSRTQLARRSCDGVTIPANAAAITGNITTVQSGGGYLTLYPSDVPQPLVANSNYAPNEILNNVFTVGLGNADGAFKIFVTTNTHIVVDVTGYYAPPSTGGLYFHPLPKPIRLLETRAGFSGAFTPGAPLPANADTPQQAHTTYDGVTIPNTALAIVGNATTVNNGAGYLTLYPGGVPRPLAASSNFGAGQVMNAPFTVGLSATGDFNIFTTTATDLVIDVLGYYSADANDANGAGLLFNPLAAPVRLLETRAGFTGCYAPGAPLQAGSTRQQQARGVCGGATIAANALAVVGNATVINDQAGYLTFWPNGAAQPLVATSNFGAGQILNRHFTAGLGATGEFNIFAPAQTDLIVDVAGFFAP